MDMEKSVGNPLRGTVIRDEARALNAQLVEWRRHLHRHPELAFDTQDTAAFVAEQLEAMGAADIKTGVGLRASGRSVCLNQNTVSPSRAMRKGKVFCSKNNLRKR